MLVRLTLGVIVGGLLGYGVYRFVGLPPASALREKLDAVTASPVEAVA